MKPTADSLRVLARRPSAYLPIAMSTAALLLLGGVALSSGLAPQPDEGAAAHVYQLLMAGQIPVVAYYLARWMGREPRASLRMFAVQVAAAFAALAPVYFLGL